MDCFRATIKLWAAARRRCGSLSYFKQYSTCFKDWYRKIMVNHDHTLAIWLDRRNGTFWMQQDVSSHTKPLCCSLYTFSWDCSVNCYFQSQRWLISRYWLHCVGWEDYGWLFWKAVANLPFIWEDCSRVPKSWRKTFPEEWTQLQQHIVGSNEKFSCEIWVLCLVIHILLALYCMQKAINL